MRLWVTALVLGLCAGPLTPCSGAPMDEADVAAWVLREGGRVIISGRAALVTRLAELPGAGFHVLGVDLVGTQIQPPDLARLSGLAELRELYLPGPMWNPGAGSTLDANDQLKYLAGLKKLETLQFSLHFLTSINIQDKGLALLGGLTGMRRLHLAQTRIKGSSLAPFLHLQSLDLSYTPFDDEGMTALRGMQELSELYLRDTLVTDAGLSAIAGLTSLAVLDLSGCRITDAGIESLRRLTHLRELNILGGDVSDEGLDALNGMTGLRALNLYRTRITNAGLAKLQKLDQLAALDLRYTRVTAAGVSSLSAALPRCRLAFVDASVQSRRAVANLKPRGAGEAALAAWVKGMGGAATFEAGRLREISLANTPVRDEQLAYLAAAPTLRNLSLETTQIGDLGMQWLAGLARLEELDLNQTTVSDAGLERLAALQELRKLSLNHTLVKGPGLARLTKNLADLEVAGTAIASLSELHSLVNLRRLNLAYSDLSDDGFAPIAGMEKLEYLDLTSTDIGDAGLARLAGLHHLQTLLLNYTRLTDAGVTALSHLAGLSRLEAARTRLTDAGLKPLAGLTNLAQLRLDYTKVTDAGVAMMRSLPRLSRLNLDSAGISDAAVESLIALHHLERLNLYHTRVTQKGYEGLKSALPACQIIWDRDSALPNRRGS